MPEHTITRTHTGFSLPQNLPDGSNFVTRYGFLMEPGEKLSVDDFAHRMCKHYSHPTVKVEAAVLRRWSALADFARDHVVHFKALPMEFEWEDGVYDYDDCLKILGPNEVNDLVNIINLN
jgi:hypothetical protein